METVKNEPGPDELAQRLSETLGDTSPLETEAPGVFYLTARDFGEVYLVSRSSPLLSSPLLSFQMK